MKRQNEGNKRRADRGGTEAIPGAVVRDLVDSNERRITSLEHELAAALRDAEEAERRVAVLSGRPASIRSDVGPTPETTAPGDPQWNGPPRTTVVTRPRPQAG